MSDKEEGDKRRYYWIKLQRDFFKRSEFKVLESLPNGKDYIIFYLKLLLESADKLGELRLSDTIPYNDNMLAALTDTHPTVVREALRFFEDMKLIEILDDETIYMTELTKMVGSETAGAIRQRKRRASLKNNCDNVALMSHNETLQNHEEYRDKSIEYKSIDSRDIDKEKSIVSNETIPKEKKAKPKTNYELILDSNETISNYPKLREAYIEFIQMRKAIKKPLTDRALELIIKDVEKYGSTPEQMIAVLNQSVKNSWQGVFELKSDYSRKQNQLGPRASFGGGNEFTALKEQEGYTGSNIFGG